MIGFGGYEQLKNFLKQQSLSFEIIDVSTIQINDAGFDSWLIIKVNASDEDNVFLIDDIISVSEVHRDYNKKEVERTFYMDWNEKKALVLSDEVTEALKNEYFK